MTDRELVDVAEASRLTGLAPSTLYKLARKGRVQTFKVLSARRFAKDDLLALVTEQQVRPRGQED